MRKNESVASEPLSLLLSAVDILSTWQTTATIDGYSRSFQQSVSLYSARRERERERVYTRHQRNNWYLIVYTLPWFYYFARTSVQQVWPRERVRLFFVFCFYSHLYQSNQLYSTKEEEKNDWWAAILYPQLLASTNDDRTRSSPYIYYKALPSSSRKVRRSVKSKTHFERRAQ